MSEEVSKETGEALTLAVVEAAIRHLNNPFAGNGPPMIYMTQEIAEELLGLDGFAALSDAEREAMGIYVSNNLVRKK